VLLAQQLETAGRDGVWTGVEELLAGLSRDVDRVLAALTDPGGELT
jgi:hypothetical protein